MLRKQLLRQARNISESLTSTSLPQVALIQRSASFSTASFTPTTRVALPTYQTSRILGRRWQSSDSEQKAADATATTPTADAASSSEATAKTAAEEHLAKVEKEHSDMAKEVVDLKDKYLRSVADYRNLQDRTKRDMDSAKQFAIQRFASDLLDSIDNLDRALTSVPKESIADSSSSADAADAKKDLLSLYSGLKMTEEILLGTLKKHGLEKFDPTEGEGRKFDPNTDEATFFSKDPSKENGDIFFVQSKGFKLHGRVIRAAKVGVVKNS
ncbi:molecular chaperone GrpE [Exophiala aquamarina CBS 119918]|uniref:GrpE protein homolog, mitochondrial n=1 Tax=Exophiala aquamarina CBS 119918 TaxID=1182545 RepID=A0A072PDN8_9EURO|nr:molecular chaperone GrpE [Exophiala aquamarina CBS 119918]KEF57867.1 molecular chaperone GrpE [Exophiala aquamarina CBS 119918]